MEIINCSNEDEFAIYQNLEFTVNWKLFTESNQQIVPGQMNEISAKRIECIQAAI